MKIEARLEKLGLQLSPAIQAPPAVINDFSDPILDLYGKQRGSHARSAVGMAALVAID